MGDGVPVSRSVRPAPGDGGAVADGLPGGRRAGRVGVLVAVLAAASAGYETWHLLGPVLGHQGRYSFLDLQVYRAGVHAYLGGRPLYSATFTDVRLPFTYPPFGVLALAVTALGTVRQAAAVLTLVDALLVIAVSTVCAWAALRPAGASRLTAVAVGLGSAALAMRLEPVTATVGFGQVNVVLCAAVVLDALVVPSRYRGVLTGLATAVKLTPAVFLVYYLLTRQRGPAARQLLTALGASLLAVLAAPGSSRRFWTSLVASDRVGPVWYTSNQSLRGVVARLLGPGPGATLGWVLASAGAGVLAVWAIRRADRAGARVLALGVCGLLGLLVSPISWSHHWVWALPAVLGAVCERVAPAVRVVGSALAVALWVGPQWRVPYTADRERHWTPWQHLVGDLHVWLALALVLTVGLGVRARGPSVARRLARSDSPVTTPG